MHTTFEILATILATIALLSAGYDFSGNEKLAADVKRWGYPAGFEKRLGLIKMVGAVGLYLVWANRGVAVAAAIGFAAYFILAVRTHLKVKDKLADCVPALVLLGLALATAIVGF